MNYPTPHIDAKPEDFAKTVLMPGDPLRSRFIANVFLDDAVLVNNIRSVQGYTGYYKGKRVSVMASGMGQPSIGIYSYELFNIFGVENIIRVGTCGSYQPDLKSKDIVIGMGACTNGGYANQYGLNGTFAPIADYGLVKAAVNACERLGTKYKVGNILSSDMYYEDLDMAFKWAKMGILGAEMEAAALYCNAAQAGKKAVSICAVSDSIYDKDSVPAEDRERIFDDLIRVCLETAYEVS